MKFTELLKRIFIVERLADSRRDAIHMPKSTDTPRTMLSTDIRNVIAEIKPEDELIDE
jgi:hypothetical protein